MATTVTVSEDVAAKLQQLARRRRQDVDTLLLTLLEQAWMQEAAQSAEPVSQKNHMIPRPGSQTEKLWGSLGQGSQEELDEVFSYDYDYELSQR